MLKKAKNREKSKTLKQSQGGSTAYKSTYFLVEIY